MYPGSSKIKKTAGVENTPAVLQDTACDQKSSFNPALNATLFEVFAV